MTAAGERGRHQDSMGVEKATTVEMCAAVAQRWEVRDARPADAPAAAAAVGELLVELGGRVPPPAALEAETRALIADPAVGILLLATSDACSRYGHKRRIEGEVVGVLAASWGRAIHVPGRYLTIQDLWVHGEWRSVGVGARLLDALAERAADAGVPRIEVGLPRESFAAIGATERFYRANGFKPLSPRLRRLLA
jgi:GNAT superfamily N-acetyltransferase